MIVLRLLLIAAIVFGFGAILDPATLDSRLFYVAGVLISSLAFILDDEIERRTQPRIIVRQVSGQQAAELIRELFEDSPVSAHDGRDD